MSRTAPDPSPPGRLGAEARREALLDVALALVEEGGAANVSMGTVAERAEVTRALVYKHFANRGDILAALYRREARSLDRALQREVARAPDGLEPKLRAFIHSVLAAVGTHGGLFVPLRPFGLDAAQRREQRAWDRRTTAYFTRLAVEELGLGEELARPALIFLLSGIHALLDLARTDPSAENVARLEDLFVEMAMASLTRLADAG